MRDDELEQEFRPVRTIGVGRPRRQWSAFDGADQRAFAERPVDDDRGATLARKRKDPCFDLALDGAVRHLHEVERLPPHDLLDFAMTPALGRRHAHITDLSRRLHGK
jgi:hypothetical protein